MISHLLTGIIRVGLRRIWAPIYVVWLRLRVWVWGAWAFEHAMMQCPPWLGIEILQAFGAQVGPEIDFHGRLILHGAYHPQGKLMIGRQCHIGPGVTLDLTGPITLEDQCTVSLNTQILTHIDVGYSPLANRVYPTDVRPTIIGQGAYIGAGAIILAGVTLGRCCVVAAGAVVREDVPAYAVVAGIPARVVKQINPADLQT